MTMSKIIKNGFLDGVKINGKKVQTSPKCHYGNYNSYSAREVKYIVVHYTGNYKDTAKGNAQYFSRTDCNVSAHFFVDDTSIYQSVALKDKAWHAGADTTYRHADCRNSNAFGIETCCTAGNYRIGPKAVVNAAYVAAYLCDLLDIPSSKVDKYVLRHYDVTGKPCPKQMVQNQTEWEDFKQMVKNIIDTGAHDKAPVKKPAKKKTIAVLAQEVIAGKWGNGDERVKKLTAAGYNAKKVQAEVDKIKKKNTKKKLKPIKTIAKEVINGKWGNGDKRVTQLTNAGYDAKAVQAEVNRILKNGK